MTEEKDLSGICEICNVKAIKENDKLCSELYILKAGIDKLNKFMTGFDDRTIECEMDYLANMRYVYLIDEVGSKLESASTLLNLIKKVGEKG